MTALLTEPASLPCLSAKPLALPSQVAYRTGGITFGMFSDGDVSLELDEGIREFGVVPANCDVTTHISLVDRLSYPEKTPLFRSGGLWALFEEAQGYRFSFLRPFEGETPYKEAWFDSEFKIGRVLLSRKFFNESTPTYPLEYPLDELMMIHRLSRGQGVEVHAVGIVDKDRRGHLFLGHSGAGKSTTARLWSRESGVHILSDDRIVLRMDGGKIRMYGTPWHGDAGIASPDSALLNSIYFLEHGSANQICPISKNVAAAELFARSFVPRHCREGLQFALSFLDRVAMEIPCHFFQFMPNGSAVEAIRRA
jgi:hypothetical protein